MDALDQCPSETRDKLESELYKLLHDQPERLCLMMTARESEVTNTLIYCNKCDAGPLCIYFCCDECTNPSFDLCETCRDKGVTCKDQSHRMSELNDAIVVEIKPQDSDMQQYIEDRVRDDNGSERRDTRTHPNPRNATVLGQECRKDPNLLQTIFSAVIEKAEGKFLFAKLYVDQLKRAKNRRGINLALNSLPRELDEIYAAAMQRIQSHEDPGNRAIALKALSLISRARRLLSLQELQHMLVTDPGDTDFDHEKCYEESLILSVTIGLIDVFGLGENAVVRVLHSSLYTYWDRTLETWFPKAEIETATTCLTYLNFSAFKTPSNDFVEFESKRDKYPFIAYASQYWGDHVRDAGPDSDIDKLVVRFFEEPLRVTASIQAAWSTQSWGNSNWDVCKGIADLHVCAWFGLSSVMSARLRKGQSAQIDVRDMLYEQTPLMYASRRGHIEVARQLLDQGAAINLESLRGRTAMLEAVMENQEEIVKVLLGKQDLEINAVNSKEHSRTALMLAAYLGHSTIVGSLLTHSAIQPNLRDANGHTALHLAVIAGSYKTVETMMMNMKSDARTYVDIADSSRRTALTIAAEKNYYDIVELLLQHHAEPSVENNLSSGTAIMRAIDYGNEGVVKLILDERREDIRFLDNDGRGLLHSATSSGRADMVCLLGDYGVNLNTIDNNGRTALHDASQEGYLEVVRTLVELGADTAIADHFGNTALDIALQYGRTQIASIISGKNENQLPDPTQSINAETSPIWLLIKLRRFELVEQSIAKRKSSLAEKEPISNNTALHYAVMYNNADVLRLLLKDDDLCPDPINRYQRTPLHLAAVSGFLEVTRVLLNHHADVNAKDQRAHTPLYLARYCEAGASQADQHFPIAVALIEAGADTKPIDVQEMFFAAVKLARGTAVQALLDSEADVHGRDARGMTAIQIAKDAGHTEILQMLKSSKGFQYSEMRSNSEGSKRRSSDAAERPSKRS